MYITGYITVSGHVKYKYLYIFSFLLYLLKASVIIYTTKLKSNIIHIHYMCILLNVSQKCIHTFNLSLHFMFNIGQLLYIWLNSCLYSESSTLAVSCPRHSTLTNNVFYLDTVNIFSDKNFLYFSLSPFYKKRILIFHG